MGVLIYYPISLRVICNAAKEYGCEIISPASINVTQGMPIKLFSRVIFLLRFFCGAFNSWKCITETCREWIENNVGNKEDASPGKDMGMWTKYAWEFFWVQGDKGESIVKLGES